VIPSRLAFWRRWIANRAKLTISGVRHAEYYRCANQATYAETNLVRAMPGVPSEAEREVHVDYGASVGQDASRPEPRSRQGSAT